MKLLTMKYPGDPAVKVEVISREEFFKIFPPERRAYRISDLGGGDETVVPLGDRIYCDSCNEDPVDFIALVGRSRAYCEECFNKTLKRYCKETK